MDRHALADDLAPAFVGRYRLQQPIARGGMATVYVARLVAAEGVTRLVAAKRLHPQFVDDPEFVSMFHDEARIASRIHHLNVVPVLDVVREGEEVILVQEYVHGVPLSYLLKRALAESTPIALSIVLAILSGVLSGLHAAHEATDDFGDPLGIVHRDVSPQNVLVSVDGIPRIVDFGIAKAKTSEHQTREGFFKGKLSYMAPEQLRGETVTRAADIYAAGVLLWELVVNRRFLQGKTDPEFVRAVATGTTLTPTEALEPERAFIAPERWAQIHHIEPIVNRAMALLPEARYATAAQMGAALLEVAPQASAAEVAAWVRIVGAEYLEHRRRILLAPEVGGAPEQARFESARAPDERSSASRLRMDAPTVDLRPSLEPRTISITVPSTTTRAERPIYSVRPILPWALSAGLFALVGLLAGMTIGHETTPTLTLRSPTSIQIDRAASEAPPEEMSLTPSEAASATVQAPVVARPATSTTARASASVRGCNPPSNFEGRKVVRPGCL